MIQFIPLSPYHLAALELQGAQAYLQRLIADPGYSAALEVPDLAFAAVIGGRVVGAAGVLPQWKTATAGRAMAWALIGAMPRAAWLAATRRALAGLELAHRRGYTRIEAVVDAGFAAGMRWAEMLGFAGEALLRGYNPPDGRDAILFERRR